MEKSHSVELGKNSGRAIFVNEQDKAMIVTFKQVFNRPDFDRREAIMYVNIYELSPTKYKTYRLINKLSKASAGTYLGLQKPSVSLSKGVYSFLDCPHPGGEVRHGTTDFTANIKDGKYEINSKMANQLIRRSQDLIYEEIQIRKQNEAKKREQEKQAETAKKNEQFGKFLPDPDKLKQQLTLFEAAKVHKAAEYIKSLSPEKRPAYSQLSEPVRVGTEVKNFWEVLSASHPSDDECVEEMKNVLQLLNVSDEDLKKANPQGRFGTAVGILLEQRRLEQVRQAGKDDFMAWMAAQQNEKIKD